MKSKPKPKGTRKVGGDRITDAEKASRVKDVAKLIIRAVPYSEIVAFCCGKWRVCERTSENYIYAANDLIKSSYERDTRTEAAKAIQRYESLLYQSESSGDFKAAAAIQDRICKLLKLWEDVVRHEAGDSITDFLQNIRASSNDPKSNARAIP